MVKGIFTPRTRLYSVDVFFLILWLAGINLLLLVLYESPALVHVLKGDSPFITGCDNHTHLCVKCKMLRSESQRHVPDISSALSTKETCFKHT